MRQRKQESSRLLNSAFREYKKLNLYSSNDNVTNAKVFLGEMEDVPLVVKKDISLLLNSIEQREMIVKAIWNEPISAPIQKDTELGKLLITVSDEKTLSFPLYAGKGVNKQSFFKRIGSTIDFIIWGSVK